MLLRKSIKNHMVFVCFDFQNQKNMQFLKLFWQGLLILSILTILSSFWLKTNHFNHTVAIFQPSRLSQPGLAGELPLSQARPGDGLHLATAAGPRGGGTAPDQLQAPIKSSAGLLLKERAQNQLQSAMKPFRKRLVRERTSNQLQSAIKLF